MSDCHHNRGARLIQYVLWNMRFVHVPQHIINVLRGMAAEEDGSRLRRAMLEGSVGEAEELGRRLGERLRTSDPV